jgi:molybdate transport system substrate-binding protein
MLKKIAIGVLMLGSSLLAESINIAVAANVSYAMDRLKSEFKKLHPDTQVQVTLGSSGKLTAQIKNGAPYQLFMSANMKYPEALYAEGIAITKPKIYAQGGLAYLSTKKQDFTKGIKLVQETTIAKIAVANPKTAPYGKAAIEAMTNGGVYEKVKGKFVFAESISQTVAYAITAADIGFIAKSSLYSPKMAHYKKDINWAVVDPKLYTPINQGIVILKNGETNSKVKAFYDFILSQKAKEILMDFGYL